MIFYITLFFVSLAGALHVILRRKKQLLDQYDVFAAEHPATFAYFMDDIAKELRGIWNMHMRDQALLFIEKRLRWVRIMVLKVERFLYQATHHVRNASNRNNTDVDSTTIANKTDSDTPDAVR